MSPAPVLASSLVRTDAGGVLRVCGSRVSLASIVTEFRNGATAESIAKNFPGLALPDVYELIAHYLRHRESLDRQLDAENAQLDQLVAPLKAEHAVRNARLRKQILERMPQ